MADLKTLLVLLVGLIMEVVMYFAQIPNTIHAISPIGHALGAIL
jgi:hypothetical protein